MAGSPARPGLAERGVRLVAPSTAPLLTPSGERRAASTYGRIALGPQPLVLFVSWTRRVKPRERGRHRVSQFLKAFGEFGAADGASLAEESLGAIESLSELLVWFV